MSRRNRTSLLWVLLLLGCGEKPMETAGATETGNTKSTKVIGLILTPDGTAASQVSARLMTSGADPLAGAPRVDTVAETDNRGAYRFSIKDSGFCNLIAVSGKSGARLLIKNIRVVGDSVMVPADTLRDPGALKLFLMEMPDLAGSYLYFAGTRISSAIDSSAIARGFLILDSLPVGPIPELFQLKPDGRSKLILAENSIRILSGDTLSAGAYSAWPYSRQVRLNTTAAGAGVPADVAGFPLLVRLDSSNFDFTQAEPRGADLRFTKSDGSPLRYEIAGWDAARKHAEAWVRMDTVAGNSASQSIRMFWGRADAPAKSDPQGVFDKSGGFTAVWHLEGDGGNSQAYTDATANHSDGKGVNMDSASGAGGMVGGAQRFNGGDGHIDIPGSAAGPLNFPENGRYSISAWVKADKLTAAYQTLVGKGDNQYNVQISFENQWHFVEAMASGTYEATEVPAAAGNWKYLTCVRNGTGQTLYINGTLADGSKAVKSLQAHRSENFTVSIGGNSEVTGQGFSGLIDEVVISGTARSADWIKLSFENQRPDQKLLSFP